MAADFSGSFLEFIYIYIYGKPQITLGLEPRSVGTGGVG